MVQSSQPPPLAGRPAPRKQCFGRQADEYGTRKKHSESIMKNIDDDHADHEQHRNADDFSNVGRGGLQAQRER